MFRYLDSWFCLKQTISPLGQQVRVLPVIICYINFTAYLIHSQLDLGSERDQGADNSQDPEQEEEYRRTAASYSLQLDDA